MTALAQGLFPVTDGFSGDPLNPGMDGPTPSAIVAGLTGSQRAQRLDALLAQTGAIWEVAMSTHLRGRELTAVAGLFSGGNDSRLTLHIMRDRLTHAIHANTGIGIEETRQFVRDTCAAWGLPLIERNGESFEAMVLERGFPGPGQHWKAFSRLKERALDAARHDLGVANSRTKAAVFVAGRRRAESDRRQDIPLHESDGSVIWVSPLANWTKLDMNTYQLRHPDLPRNQVADLLHMSGECLCGSFAKPGELDMIGDWYPEVVAYIRGLEVRATAAGIPHPLNLWGWGADPDLKRVGTGVARSLGERLSPRKGRLCTSCSVSPDALFATAVST